MSLFITFEGGEGCGKSVQSRALYRHLVRMHKPVILLHEPGGTRLGKSISHLLKWSRNTGISPLAELLLFNASRANLVREVIKPALDSGKIVICDRFADSTIAYQGYGRGLDMKTVKSVCDIAVQSIKPDLTVLLDIPAKEGLSRKARMRADGDRFEKAEVAFHERLHGGYLKMAKDEPRRWFVVDGLQSRETIRDIIWQKVGQLLAVG
jgi:dTMP kinase